MSAAARAAGISRVTAHKWLVRGREEGGLLDRPSRPRRSPGRIERVGHRIHGNRTTRVRGAGWEYVHVAIDDASRVACVEMLRDEKGDTTAAFLRRAVAWFRTVGVRVRRILTDNGTGYLARLFAQACAELRVRHGRTRPYRPCTNGKAERFIQALLREWAYAVPYVHSRVRTAALPRWLHHYNRRRPHSSLAGAAPFSRLQARCKQRA